MKKLIFFLSVIALVMISCDSNDLETIERQSFNDLPKVEQTLFNASIVDSTITKPAIVLEDKVIVYLAETDQFLTVKNMQGDIEGLIAFIFLLALILLGLVAFLVFSD